MGGCFELAKLKYSEDSTWRGATWRNMPLRKRNKYDQKKKDSRSARIMERNDDALLPLFYYSQIDMCDKLAPIIRVTMVTSKYTTKNAQMKGFHLPFGGKRQGRKENTFVRAIKKSGKYYLTVMVTGKSMINIAHIDPFLHIGRPVKSILVVPALFASNRQTQALSVICAKPAGLCKVKPPVDF
jgi:hypothetical protein